ncbi:aftiphilin-like [Salarias fasciatus]|uniref:aftiphilin-like n=1 Tax=Salarias fasciatus TaxID=181472 RepID=UPI001176A484|nr:aftiphilin-like [Salarias fasciatus]
MQLAGVDPELYELSTRKLESSSSSSSHVEDALQRLLSSAQKTCISVRNPLQDESLSADACSVLSGLPSLSFMQAKVLVFPSILVPEASRPPDV